MLLEGVFTEAESFGDEVPHYTVLPQVVYLTQHIFCDYWFVFPFTTDVF